MTVKNHVFFWGFILALSPAFGQLVQQAARHQAQNNSKRTIARRALSADTTKLPFIDYFTSREFQSHWQENRGVYLNDHIAANPPSYGTLTFDGIDGTGEPYVFVDFISQAEGIGDRIVSAPIDLSNVTMEDGLALSFFWQLGSGFVKENTPEFKDGDRLEVQFKDINDRWTIVWPTPQVVNQVRAMDPSNDTFLLANVLVGDEYFYNGFQFRIQYENILTGNWDTFSLDNIYLNTGVASTSSTGETTFKEPIDYAISQRPNSLFKEYWTLPYTHAFLADQEIINDSISASVYTLDDLFITDQDSSVVVTNQNTKEVIFQAQSNTFDNQTLTRGAPFFINWELDKAAIKQGIDAITTLDETILKTTVSFSAPDTIPFTDSASSFNRLSDYYARDDGSIEGGTGFIGRGELVMAFDILSEDVIKGFFIHYFRNGVDHRGKSVVYKLYDALAGVDGASADNLLYRQSDVVEYSQDSIGINSFLFVPFSTRIPVNAGRYYLGFENEVAIRILIGTDYNTDESKHIFARTQSNPWRSGTELGVIGALAIRPAMSSVTIGVEEKKVKSLTTFFPNPATHQIQTSDVMERVQVLSLSGQVLLSIEPKGTGVDLSGLQAGTYIIQFFKEGTTSFDQLMIY